MRWTIRTHCQYVCLNDWLYSGALLVLLIHELLGGCIRPHWSEHLGVHSFFWFFGSYERGALRSPVRSPHPRFMRKLPLKPFRLSDDDPDASVLLQQQLVQLQSRPSIYGRASSAVRLAPPPLVAVHGHD